MPSTRQIPDKRSVVLVGSEAQPFSKTGGLADVLGALPPALARLGWDATVVLPRYRGVAAGTEIDAFTLTVGGRRQDVRLLAAPLPDGAKAILVDAPELYDREGIYGIGTTDYADSPRRFAVLARATLEHILRTDAPPAVIHAHDWQGGLIPVYLRSLYASHPVLGGLPTVFTIHNQSRS